MWYLMVFIIIRSPRDNEKVYQFPNFIFLYLYSYSSVLVGLYSRVALFYLILSNFFFSSMICELN